MFNKILIANRGEIALRIIRACKEMGIKTGIAYSQADEDSLPVRLADQAVCIGSAPSSASYLLIERIISVGEICDVDAIHPGYGFLSENNQVIIDGKVIVDKDNDVVKRSESGGGTVALKKGLHKIKVVFIGYNGDGWPTYHNNTRVRICNTSKNENFKDVTPDMLFHEVPMFE